MLRTLYGSGTGIEFFLNKSLHIQAIGAIWFLVAMFWGNLIFNGLLKIKEQLGELLVITLILLMSILGFYLTKKGIYLPWSLNAALVSQVFYYAGFLMRRFDLIVKGKWFFFCGAIVLGNISS